MDKAICTVQVDKGAKVSQAGDAACVNLALFKFADDTLLERGTRFSVRGPLREDQAAALAVHFDNADRDRLPNHLLPALFRRFTRGLAAARRTDLRGGYEAAQTTNAHNQAALVEADDLAINHGLIRDHLFNVFPG